jgi:GNAT superfamily N-acetyltransferase
MLHPLEEVMKPTKLREAVLEDAPIIAKLSSKLGYPADLPDVEKQISRIADDPSQVLFVSCNKSDTVLGWIHVFRTIRVHGSDFTEIGGLVVEEEHRSEGLGRKLLAEAESWSQRQGCSKMVIRSNIIRAEAHQFYLKAGYQTLKQQKVFLKQFN